MRSGSSSRADCRAAAHQDGDSACIHTRFDLYTDFHTHASGLTVHERPYTHGHVYTQSYGRGF